MKLLGATTASMRNHNFYKPNFYYIVCKDSICNDPKMILGSHVKGPNNIICRAWAWKARPWSPNGG